MIHSAWLTGVKASDRDKRTQEVKAYSKAFADLTEVLKTNFKKKPSDRDYSDGWNHRQIAVNEYNSVLDDLLKLLNLEGNTK